MTGEYCAACGQRRLERLTLGSFAADVVRRVFRFDKALAVTVWRMLRDPGRRSGYLDPLHYLFSGVFAQVAVAAFRRRRRLAVPRPSAGSGSWAAWSHSRRSRSCGWGPCGD